MAETSDPFLMQRQDFFSHDAFRPEQEKVLRSALNRQDALRTAYDIKAVYPPESPWLILIFPMVIHVGKTWCHLHCPPVSIFIAGIETIPKWVLDQMKISPGRWLHFGMLH